MARAMILAAGFGTRLRPLTAELPKPLLPLGDRPVLAHVAERLARAGIEGAVINAHHLREQLIEFARTRPFFLHVEHEPEIRGTAGGVCGARRYLGPGPVVVANADLVLDPPVKPLLEGAALCGMAMAVALRARGEGRVGVAADGKVARLRDERFCDEEYGADYLSACAIGPALLSELPERGCLVGDVAIPWLRRGEGIVAVPVSGTHFSVGDSIADYLAANRRWLELASLPNYVGRGAVLGDQVVLEGSVIGEGAELSGAGSISGCVVWPGARAKAPLSGAVVTTSGTIAFAHAG